MIWRMTSKSARGRRRYIAFRIVGDCEISADEIEGFVEEFGKKMLLRSAKIIEISGNFGIIRCAHRDKEKMIEILRSVRLGNGNIWIETLRTSGTLRALRNKVRSRY